MPQTKAELLSREQIERRAYELYLESGCIHGRDEENWHAAEAELQKEYENRDLHQTKNATILADENKLRTRLSKSAAN